MTTTPHVTIHHIRGNADKDLRLALREGEVGVTKTTIERYYAPAETVLYTADREEAFRAAQGETVNREQGGRHMVHSASPGDVFEVRAPGLWKWYRVDSIGWAELDIEGPVDNTGNMPHTEPLLA